MPAIEIRGGMVEYEFVGATSGPVVALTPGGRFSKEERGLRDLANALAAGGVRVLIWDRPITGKSDVQFFGPTESHMRAETLNGLLTGLDVAPCVIAGGSGGARDSMLTVILHPELATKLIVWSIVGGVFGTVSLTHNVLPNITVLRSKGIEGLLEIQPWKQLIETNPRNRERMLALGTEGMERVMLRWLNAFIPRAGQTIPGVEDELFEKIQVPTMVIRGGANDIYHPKRTSLEVHCLIAGSKLLEPPWPEDAWEQMTHRMVEGKGYIFDYWVQGAPAMLDFIRSV